MHAPNVSVDVKFLRRSVAAVSVWACKRLHAGMSSTVHDEVARVRRAISAMLATERFHSGMFAKMHGEIRPVSGAITALLATKRLGACMRSNVLVKVAFMRRAILAIDARVPLCRTVLGRLKSDKSV